MQPSELTPSAMGEAPPVRLAMQGVRKRFGATHA